MIFRQHIIINNIAKENWRMNNPEIIQEISSLNLNDDFFITYNCISDRRNRINHAQFNDKNQNNINFKNDLIKYYQTIKEYLLKCL
jgi:hypothetical protein